MTTYQKWSMTEDAKKENEDGGFELMIIKKFDGVNRGRCLLFLHAPSPLDSRISVFIFLPYVGCTSCLFDQHSDELSQKQ